MSDLAPHQISEWCWLNAPPPSNFGDSFVAHMPTATPGGKWRWRIAEVVTNSKTKPEFYYKRLSQFVDEFPGALRIKRGPGIELQTVSSPGVWLVGLELWSCYEKTPSGREIWRYHAANNVRMSFRRLP